MRKLSVFHDQDTYETIAIEFLRRKMRKKYKDKIKLLSESGGFTEVNPTVFILDNFGQVPRMINSFFLSISG